MRPLYACLFVVLSALAGAVRGEPPRIESFFSPDQDCTKEIVNRIDDAKREVLVQAYRFDSEPIAKALIRAKNERNVDVQVILDSRHRADKKDVAALLQAAGIPTRTYAPRGGIDHNKVIVVDKATVMTGSFNFTEHAKANAENLVIDRDADDVARYVADWKRCAAHADAKPVANEAKAAGKAAKAVARAVKAAKAKAAAYTEAAADWAEAEAGWDKAEKDAAADATSADQTVA
jgi:phosphatidylserine/phosphatidylglycerophosphate/cardiolipin synthase-like enzyme